MGVVYQARAADGREVALKVLNVPSAEARARFAREARLLRALGAADGFVPIVDAGERGGHPFLVMPLLRGGTLRARLEAGPLAVEEVVRIGARLARALGRAHAQGIV